MSRKKNAVLLSHETLNWSRYRLIEAF